MQSRGRSSGGVTVRCAAVRAGLIALLPGMFVVEWVGSTFGAPLTVSSIFFAAVVAMALYARLPPPHEPGGESLASWWLGVGLVVCGGLLCWPAVAPLLPSGTRPLEGLGADASLIAALGGAWLVGVGVSRLERAKGGERGLRWLGASLSLEFFGQLVAARPVQGLPVVPPGLEAELRVLAVLAFTALVAPGIGFAARLVLLALTGVCLRVMGLATWQPDPLVRDMLPLVESAWSAFKDGDTPYRVYAMQSGSQVPLTYLPGLWLIHGVPTLVGLPLRTASIAADLLITMGWGWMTQGMRGRAAPRARAVVLVLAACWWFSPSVQWNAVYAEPQPWWALLLWVAALAARGRWSSSAVLLGIALVTRHFAWVLLPFWALGCWRALGTRLAVGRFAWALAVPASLLPAFVARDPEAFWFGTLRWLVAYGPAHASWFTERLGFAGTLYRLGAESALALLQGLTLALTVLFGWRASRGHPARALEWAAIGYAAFVMFNPIIWDSFYLGLAAWLSVPVLARMREVSGADGPSSAQTPARHQGLALAVATVFLELGAGAYLFGTLIRTTSRAGFESAARAVREGVSPGALVIDQSSRELTFFRERPPAALPGSVSRARHLFTPALGPRGGLDAGEVWLLRRADRSERLDSTLRALGRLVVDGSNGRYRWLAIHPYRLSAPLTELRPEWTASNRGKGLVHRAVRSECMLDGAPLDGFVIAIPASGDVEGTWQLPPGARALLVVAGVADTSVRWRDPGLELSISEGHQPPLAVWSLENLPGAQSKVVALPETLGPVSLRVSARHPQPGARRICATAWVSGGAKYSP